MKVLVVHPGPEYSVADVHNGLLRGLRACGVDAREYNMHDRLAFYAEAQIERDGETRYAFSSDAAIGMAAKGLSATLYEWWPDVVVIVSGFFVPPFVWAVLARRPHHVVLWCTESPYEDDRQLRPAEFADTVILNDPLNLSMFRAVNERSYYFPHSYDPAIHYPGEGGKVHDFAFVGTGFASRIEFFEAVEWGAVVPTFAGNWQAVEDGSPLEPFLADAKGECLDNLAAADLYRASAMSMNLYRREATEASTADGVAMGPREVELAACGTFFLRDPRPEGDDLFPMLPTFRSVGEFSELLDWWHRHPVERESAAVAARAAVADRTFTATAARLLALVDGAVKTMR